MFSGNGRWRRSLLASLVALAALAVAAPAWAGQIVYTHGNDLWAMNDNGTNQHLLVTGAQVGGQIGFSGSGGDLGVGVEPNGNGIAFDAAVPASDGKCSANCPGLYSLLNGKLLRLSGAPADCSTITTYCGGEDIDPAVTSNGHVVYYSLFVTSTPDCDIYYCGSDGGYTEQYFYRSLDGSNAPADLAVTRRERSEHEQRHSGPTPNSAARSRPIRPTRRRSRTPVTRSTAWASSATTDALGAPAATATRSTSRTAPAPTTSPRSTTSSTTGLLTARTDRRSPTSSRATTGESGSIPLRRAISAAHQRPANPSAKYTWALADPDNGTSGNPFDRVINGLTFVGNNELVFSANYNLWSIPASCWATPVNPSSPAAGCGTFPSGATQLTHDGNVTTPDTEPAWTSSATPIEAYGTGPPVPTTFKVSLSASHSQKLEKQKDLVATVKCNVICAFGTLAGIEIKGSKKELDSKQAGGQLAANGSKTVKLKFSSGVLKTVKKALAKHRKVTAFILVEAKDEAGKEISAHTSFHVTH